MDKENGEGFFSVFDNTVETQNLPITFLFETPVSELIVDGKKIDTPPKELELLYHLASTQPGLYPQPAAG